MYNDYLSAFGQIKEQEEIYAQNSLEVFSAKVQKIIEHNSDPDNTWTMGINKFSDLTDEEFNAYFRLNDTNDEQKCSATASPKIEYNISTPLNFDWREYGVVTPVKNQGHCGSCWTFSTVGALESHFYMSQAYKLSFSEQVLVDCAREEYDCHGCSGGLPSYAFNYIRDHGLTINETYPYRAEDGTCNYDESTAKVFTKGPFNITSGDEEQLVQSLFHQGPVSVAFQVVDGFRDYKDGVYSSRSCKNGPMDVNHAVLAVGYGVDESGYPYYIIKNSWGKDWGDKGFFKIIRNKNMCGIAVCNSYPEDVTSYRRYSFSE